MLEKHPFGVFVPPNSKYLLLGSFVTKPTHGYEWFYANGRNQFWPILEEVYGLSLKTKTDQQDLFTKLSMAIADIILECERKKNSNLDSNLKCLVFNTQAIAEILAKNTITKIFFTSRYVEKLFRKEFKDAIMKYPNIELLTLPSPSPRYALMTKLQKIAKYKKLLPKLGLKN
jgi:hypoxanthine-DNA glycosylase